VRGGRTFVTNGPLLYLDVNGAEPGATLHLVEKMLLVVRVEAVGVSGGEIEVIANGEVIAAGTGPLLEVQISIDQGGWLAARCRQDHLMAHTSPIHLCGEGSTSASAAGDVSAFSDLLSRTLEWIEREARCGDGHRQRLAGGVQAARLRLK
jgi:hypothetical protein